jgi:hypothetical protein
VSVPLRLNQEQHLHGAGIGYARTVNAVRRGFEPRHRNGSLWGGSIEGACTELAGSLVTGLPWTGETVWETPPREPVPDLGRRTEVRWGERRPLLNFDRDRDKDSRAYILVTGFAPNYVVHGWILGGDCRRDEWLTVYPERAVYRVPLEALNPINRRYGREEIAG